MRTSGLFRSFGSRRRVSGAFVGKGRGEEEDGSYMNWEERTRRRRVSMRKEGKMGDKGERGDETHIIALPENGKKAATQEKEGVYFK